jgi:hypothetical protein
VHLFRPRLNFLAEAQPRLENRRGQKAFSAEVTNLQINNKINNKKINSGGILGNASLSLAPSYFPGII